MSWEVTPARSAAVVALASFLVFANSLPNGFAFDDETFITSNPVVTEARFGQAFSEASWPDALEGQGNYRPLVLASYAAEYALWSDRPLPYHIVSVLAHTGVCVLVLLLLGHFVSPLPALAGALFFAVHPVHVEAVANVMGRSELYAALAYLAACLLYLRERPQTQSGIAARTLAIVALAVLSVGSKEIGVTLPAALVLLELGRFAERPLIERIKAHAATYAAVAGAIACFLFVRWGAIGAFTGEEVSVRLDGLDTTERWLAAAATWPHYLRLMIAPIDLVADYGPDVLPPVTGVNAAVVAGVTLAVGSLVLAWRLRTSHPIVALGIGWFVVAVSPVSNLVVRADVLLAERILYLPSVGAALVVAAVVSRVPNDAAIRRRAFMVASIALVAFSARTVHRNPSWESSFEALTTLAAEHPESWLAYRTQATSLALLGDGAAASHAYDEALARAPTHYQLIMDAAEFHAETGGLARAVELLDRARSLQPRRDLAYVHLGNLYLQAGEGRRAHAVATDGLRLADDPSALWAVLSEAYVSKTDLVGAARARRTSLAHGADPAFGWARLSELYAAMGREEDADLARRRALEARRDGGAS